MRKKVGQASPARVVTTGASSPVSTFLDTARPWLRKLALALAALTLFNWFFVPIGTGDFWWHLKTGQEIWEHHALPVPDHFSFTTYLGAPAYAGEEITRYFNLTHEWLAQAIFYLAYKMAGFAGVILLRQALMTGLCAIIGWIVYRRCGGLYRAIAAPCTLALLWGYSSEPRPFLFGYFLLGVTFLAMESRRYLWLLPAMFILWANCHSSFFLGWIVMGAYCAEALVLRWRGKPQPHERQLLLVTAASVLASGINPNGYRVFQVLFLYRQSPLQMGLLEWLRPKYWELSPFTAVLYISAAVLLWARRRVRVADWLIYIVFAVAALSAVRNIILLGIIGAIVIFSYLPEGLSLKRASDAAAVLLLLAACVINFPRRPVYGVPPGTEPAEAADFLLAHHIHGRMLNSYLDGGYLIWRLGPRQQVFMDGRALNETAAADLQRILFNAVGGNRPSGEQLLNQYGIDLIVIPVLDPYGRVYNLPVSLADPSQKTWKLIFRDSHTVIFVKQVPDGVQQLNPLEVLTAMEMQCRDRIDHTAFVGCAREVSQAFSIIGDKARAMQWMNTYREHSDHPDSPLTVK